MQANKWCFVILAAALALAGCAAPTSTPVPAAELPTAIATPTEMTDIATPTATTEIPATATPAGVTSDEATLAAELLAAAPADAYAGVQVLPLPGPDSRRPLWVAHSYGMRNYDLDPAVPHFVAVYSQTDGTWAEIARLSLDEPAVQAEPAGESISADYLDEAGVQVVSLDATNLWIEVQAGIGAHGGVYQLLRFDGTDLIMQLAASSPSPGMGRVADVNGDGSYEVVLDTSDPYVFCYACGLRRVSFQVWNWDAETGALAQVTLEPLAAAQGEGAAGSINEAVALAQAGLWRAAGEQVAALSSAQVQALDEATRETVTWDIALIRLTSEAMEAELEGGYPLLAYVFYGDYEGAVGLMRELAPEEIYTAASSLIIGTVAEGWTEGLGQNLVDSADSAIAARPDLAAAYLTRSWGAYLLDPASAQARADAARAAELAPGDDFYAACAAYVETAPTTAGYVPAPVYLAEGIQAAVQDALGAAGVLSEEPFIDPLTGLGGTGRQVTISGTGVDFASFVAVADTLRQVLEAQGWAEDVSYQADGPTGTAFGYRLDAALALVNVGWEPAPGADCPEDQPISDCDLAPEERLYTITLNIAEQ